MKQKKLKFGSFRYYLKFYGLKGALIREVDNFIFFLIDHPLANFIWVIALSTGVSYLTLLILHHL